jgi:uncharacterized protein YuzE
MRIAYDAEADAAYVTLSDAPVAEVRDLSDVCVLDIAADGSVVGIELLSVFGFAGAALADLVARGVVDRQTSNAVLGDLRVQLKAA